MICYERLEIVGNEIIYRDLHRTKIIYGTECFYNELICCLNL